MKPGKTSRPSCWATSRRTRSNAAPCSSSSWRADLARGLQDLHHVGDDPRRLVRGVPGDVVAQARRSDASSHTGRRLGHQRRDRGGRGVLEHRPRRTRAAPPSARAAAGVAELGPGTGAAGTGSSARAAGACRRACAAPAPPGSPARAARPSRPRRPATGTRGSSGRCRAARRPSGSSRTSSSSGRCARACSWPAASAARSFGRTCSRSALRSCPAAIDLAAARPRR